MKNFRKYISIIILISFITSLTVNPAGAQLLPLPGSPVGMTASFQPPVLLGLKIHPENPFLFDFIVDQGASQLSDEELKAETEKLVKYFLAALTIPDKEVWVNLSPYEKDRIIPDVLGQTGMGKTMLQQDYILKQLASSLTNPQEKLGQEFWSKVRAKVGNENIEASTLSKVWIVPSKAEVLESQGIVLVGEKSLKVMMNDEYEKRLSSGPSSEIFRSTILPNIEKEVNEGKNFADVRQIYNSVILATWYKKALRESLLGKVYADKGKVAGVETDDKEMKQKIYEQYLAAFKKGAYNLIKEETDAITGETIPRKYFSGGLTIVPESIGVRNVARGVIEQKLQASSGVHDAMVQLTAGQNERDLVSAKRTARKILTASSGVNKDKKELLRKEFDFNKAVATYRVERIKRAYETIRWWGKQKGLYSPDIFLIDLNATINLSADTRNQDPQLIKDFLTVVRILLNNAASGTAGGLSRMGALLNNNYEKFSAFYDLIFNEELTNPVGTSGISSRVSAANFHSELVVKADAILTEAQKAEFIAIVQPDYPQLNNFFVLEVWAQNQDIRKTGSGRIWNALISYTKGKIEESKQLFVQSERDSAAATKAQRRQERELVDRAADDLLLSLENVLPSLKGVRYDEMSSMNVLLRELVYEGYYIYLQDESPELALGRGLDDALLKHLTTVKLPGRDNMSLAEVKQTVERLGFERNGNPGVILEGQLVRTLRNLSASSALREQEFVKAIGAVGDKVLANLLKTSDLSDVPDPVRIFLNVLIRDAAQEQEPWYERTTFANGANGYRLLAGLLAMRLYEESPEMFNRIGIKQAIAADGSTGLRLSDQFVQEIERQGGAVPGIFKRLTVKEMIFNVEAKRLAYTIMSSSDPQSAIDRTDDFVDQTAADLDQLKAEDINIDVIRDALSGLKGVDPVIGAVWVSAFESLEKAYHSDGILLLLEFVEFWAEVQNVINNDRSQRENKDFDLNAIELARAILNAPDVQKASNAFDMFTADYMERISLKEDRGEIFEELGKVDLIGSALQSSLGKLAEGQDFQVAKSQFGWILGMTAGFISTASSGVSKAEYNFHFLRGILLAAGVDYDPTTKTMQIKNRTRYDESFWLLTDDNGRSRFRSAIKSKILEHARSYDHAFSDSQAVALVPQVSSFVEDFVKFAADNPPGTASSALEVETAINTVVGDIEKMLEETKDFKEESESDLARLSRAGRESYAAFRLRRAQWPVDLKVLREDVENYKVSQRDDLLAGILRTAEDLANEIRTFWEVKDKPQSWSYWTAGRNVRTGRDELMSTGKEIGRYEFLFALRHGLITQGDLVIVNVNDDAPARFRRPQRFGTIEKIVAPGLIELWGANKVNLDLGGVIVFENDPSIGFSLRDVVSARLIPSSSSGVTLSDQRKNLVGQAINDLDQIMDAFRSRRIQVGDQVDVRYIQFDAAGNPAVKVLAERVSAINPMNFRGEINGKTILRVGTSGMKLENVQSITLVSLADSAVAASSGVVEPSVASRPVGGIDFDPSNMNLQIKRDGRGVPLPLPQQNLEQINIEGLFPVIINIVPVNAKTLPIFLGKVLEGEQSPQKTGREADLTVNVAS